MPRILQEVIVIVELVTIRKFLITNFKLKPMATIAIVNS